MKYYDNFFLPAADLEQAREFYGDVLGLALKFDLAAQGMLAFNIGYEEPAIFLSRRHSRPSIWFEVEDVPSSYDALKVKGVRFLSAPFEVRTGLAVEFADPFGNRLGLTDYSRGKPQASESTKRAAQGDLWSAKP